MMRFFLLSSCIFCENSCFPALFKSFIQNCSYFSLHIWIGSITVYGSIIYGSLSLSSYITIMSGRFSQHTIFISLDQSSNVPDFKKWTLYRRKSWFKKKTDMYREITKISLCIVLHRVSAVCICSLLSAICACSLLSAVCTCSLPAKQQRREQKSMKKT